MFNAVGGLPVTRSEHHGNMDGAAVHPISPASQQPASMTTRAPLLASRPVALFRCRHSALYTWSIRLRGRLGGKKRVPPRCALMRNVSQDVGIALCASPSDCTLFSFFSLSPDFQLTSLPIRASTSTDQLRLMSRLVLHGDLPYHVLWLSEPPQQASPLQAGSCEEHRAQGTEAQTPLSTTRCNSFTPHTMSPW